MSGVYDLASTPPTDNGFLREVDEAVRQDQLIDLWQRYGRALVVVVVAGLVAFGGWIAWQDYRQKQAGELAEKAQTMMTQVAAGKQPDAQLVAALADSGRPGYRAMALLTQAGAAAAKGDTARASSLYGQVAGDGDIAAPWRDLATVRQVALDLDRMAPQAVVDKLKPLALEGGPWFASATEMTGIAYLKMGKRDLAKSLFAALAKDKEAPPAAQLRAQQMAAVLGADVSADMTLGSGEEKSGNAQAGE